MRYLFPLFLLVSALLGACSHQPPHDPSLWEIDRGKLPPSNLSLKIDGLGPCTDNPDRTLHLDRQQPLTILTHGCFASSGRFRALSEVFAFHGQQTACFTYDDRDSMVQSSAELIAALQQLATKMENKHITIIGHSQGGLITRKALVQERDTPLDETGLDIRLVTISAPFRGIEAAAHCGSPLARVLSLGLVVPVCYAISGGKWYEITPASPFMRQPGSLLPQVNEHLKIVTDERNTCRRYDAEGSCLESDDIFTVAEQYHPPVDAETRVNNIEIPAGHVEIVGGPRVAPEKLIRILQDNGIMKETPASQQARFNTLLTQLYDLSP
ncbi:MAG: alpha/beta hydrolase [Gammaproteobacteria bacterium]